MPPIAFQFYKFISENLSSLFSCLLPFCRLETVLKLKLTFGAILGRSGNLDYRTQTSLCQNCAIFYLLGLPHQILCFSFLSTKKKQ